MVESDAERRDPRADDGDAQFFLALAMIALRILGLPPSARCTSELAESWDDNHDRTGGGYGLSPDHRDRWTRAPSLRRAACGSCSRVSSIAPSTDGRWTSATHLPRIGHNA